MTIKKPYNHTDSAYEITYKNKYNIVDLYAQLILLSELTGKSFDELGKLVGDYDQDINGNLDASKSVIENLSIVAENLTSEGHRIDSNEKRLTSVESRVTTIENDGIGNYLGTFRTIDNNDSSTLPNPAQDKDRAITEYLVVDDYKYQEWEWNKNGGNTWDKIGVELDSHIHSQSAGISLGDVANQQDPKIAKKLDKTTFELYEEKEITITPAIYGWKKILDLWSNPDKFRKYGLNRIRAVDNTSLRAIEMVINAIKPGSASFSAGGIDIASYGLLTYILDETIADTLLFTLAENRPVEIKDFDIQIWDIITPEVKAIVLVKK